MKQLRRGMGSDASGAVMLEFLLAFVPVLTLLLGITQLGLLAVGRAVVQHAAAGAARVAVVVLEDDPKHYGGQPRGSVARTERRSSATRAGGGAHLDLQAILTGLSGDDSRAGHVSAAALMPLSALAPSPMTLMGTYLDRNVDVASSFEPSPLGRALFGATWYGHAATAVTFPRSPGSRQLRRGAFGAGELVTVRVTYLLHCAVPLIARAVCGRAPKAAGSDLVEVQNQAGLRLLRASGARFAVLSAEATLPLQSAGYERRGGGQGG